MSYQSEVLADAPLIYWRLGEASGTTAADASGNGHTGTYTNGPTLGVPGLLTGDANTAVQFVSASNQSCNGDDTPLGPTTVAAFTIEVIADTPGSGVGQLWMLSDPAGAAADFIELYYDAGSLKCDFQGTSASSPTASFAASGLHHIAGVFNGTTLRLYVDGVQVDSQAFSDAGALLAVADVFSAGNYPGVGTVGADAVIDEAAFYPTALSPARIAAHYAAMIAGVSPTVSSLTPDNGDEAGGIPVVIGGTDFTGASDVTFGGTSVLSFVVDTDSQITATSPPHAPGTVTVAVVA